MKLIAGLIAAWLLLAVPLGARAAPLQQYRGEVSSPRANAVLRGQVAVDGTADHPEFWKYEVRIAAGLNPSIPDDQWTRLTVQEQRVINGRLAVWDTTFVPDGVYTLRLRVVRLDGNWQDFDIRPLNVGNAAPPTATPAPPTATPEPASPTPEPSPTAETTPTESPTPVAATTLTPSAGTPTALATLASGVTTPLATSLATPLIATGSGATATPIIIDQPTIIVPTTEADEEGDEESDGAGGAAGAEGAPTPPSSGSSPLPSLPTGLGAGLNLGTLTSACITGASFTAAIFVIVGFLYLLKSLIRVFR